MTSEQKPLMIRGDRLLFALDVLAALCTKYAYYWYVDSVTNMRRYPSSIEEWPEKLKNRWPHLASLSVAFFSPDTHRYESSKDYLTVVAGSYLHSVLVRAQNISGILFDAQHIIDRAFSMMHFVECHSHRLEFEDFFRAVACCELTEADFR